MLKHIILAEKFNLPNRYRSHYRNRFLLKGLLPIIALSLFLTLYTFSFSTTPLPSDIPTTSLPSDNPTISLPSNNPTISLPSNIPTISDIPTTSLPSDISTSSLPSDIPTTSLPSDVSTIVPGDNEITFNNEVKYLTYLPHSGFHNQRISFINALLLSHLTNRTLIIPPILVNSYPRDYTVHELYDKINEIIQIKKYRKDNCTNNTIDKKKNYYDDEFCKKFYSKHDKFTMTNWDQLFDFSEIKKHVRTVNRGYEITLDSLLEKFNFSEDDIHLFVENNEIHRYDIRIYDTDKSTVPLYDYGTKLLLSDLLKIDKKLLHFGSLFNPTHKKPTNISESFYDPYRIVLDRKENLQFNQFIHDNLIVNNSKVLNVTDRIVHELGGEGSYFGLHIRVGDGIFRTNKSLIANMMYDNLMDEFQNLSLTIRKDKKFFSYGLKNCLKKNLTRIFIATDSKNPRKDFEKFYENIPCVFTLFDFNEELKFLDNSFSDYDENIDLNNFYASLIDLLTAAYGKIFIGTVRSTFSKMAYEVHGLHIH